MKKKLVLSSILVLILTQTFFAQTPQASKTPPIKESEEIIEENEEVVKITSSLIQIDVVVTNKDGRQVTGLTSEDFEIFENGKKKNISYFSFISGKKRAEENAKKNQKKVNEFEKPPVPSIPRKVKSKQVRRTYAIVVDDLGISFENVPAMKSALKNFVNEDMQPNDLVAIIRVGGGIGVSQSFTSNKKQLLAAIEQIRWNIRGRGKISAFGNFQDSIEEIPDRSVNNDNRGSENSKLELEDTPSQNENFSVGTLGALRYVIKGMETLPGRKSILFFSEGFQTFRLESDRNSLLKDQRIFNDVPRKLRVLAEFANRSSVVIYTLDTRGLVNPAMISRRENIYLEDSQYTLRYLAKETGGLAYVDQNKLQRGIRKAVEDQSGYYLIAYEPDSETFDEKKDKFNKLKVKVKNSKYNVRYRSGFFGVSETGVKKTGKEAQNKLYNALISPFSIQEINLSLYSVFANDKIKGNFLRSFIGIKPEDVVFKKVENNLRKANFDIIAITFGNNGVPIDKQANNYTIQVKESGYQKILKKGFTYSMLIPIKKPGAYQFRIAIKDTVTNKVGSASQFIEIPNLQKNRLNLSSIILTGFTREQLNSNTKVSPNGRKSSFLDTSLRQFNQGTTLRYDYVIYNAAGNLKKLKVQAKLFKERKLLLQSKPTNLITEGQKDLKRIKSFGSITLGKDLPPGDYILQILVKDENVKKKKHSLATQIIDFEVLEN